MTAWTPIEDESRSIPEEPDPDPEPTHRSWLKITLISVAIVVAAIVFLFYLPSAIGESPPGGCGGG